MDFKANKAILMLLSIFLISIYASAAEINDISAAVTPSSPVTKDNLKCVFTVTGNETSYTANATWLLDGSDYVNAEVSVNDGQEKTLTLDKSETTKGDDWGCVIEVEDTTETSNTVNVQNSAPVITSNAVTSGLTDGLYRYNVQASDDDNDVLTYSLTTSPTGMNINTDTGAITWTPTQNQSGSNSVTLVVSDGDDTDTQSFTVSVTSNKLVITSITAKCSPKCDDDDLDDEDAMRGDAGTIMEVKPGADLTLKVKVENTWPDNTKDHDIEDIELDCTLEDIGDDDEIDENIDFGKLNPDENSDKEEMDFEVSFEADDGDTYTIDCTLIGDDEDGTDYDIDFKVDIEIEKENHEVTFQRATLNPASISCNRNFQLSYMVKNTGAKDEDDVQVVVRNDALDLFRNELIDELREGTYDDEDTEFDTTYSFSLDDDVKVGTYPIHMEVFFDDGDDSEIEILDLTVSECVSSSDPKEDEPDEKEPEEKEEEVIVDIIDRQPQQPSGQGVNQAQPTTTVVSSEGIEAFTNSVWFILLLAIVVLVLLGLLVWMVVMLVKK